VTPPLTAFAPCLSGWTTITNFHWQRASGFALFVAGTDYTKNSAGNFVVSGISAVGNSTSTYYQSIVYGGNLI